MNRVEGKVALITGAARGQGRSHALRLAEEGADIIAVDICSNIEGIKYSLATSDDLAETIRKVEALDRRIIATEADVRDDDALSAAVNKGVAELGRLDIVVANAGIFDFSPSDQIDPSVWKHILDVNLTGVWNTARAALPHLRASGPGGSMIFTSSVAGLIPQQNFSHYVAAKHGVVGLMRTLALELAPEMIRVNTVNPTSVNTKMIHNDAVYALFAPELAPEERTLEVIRPRFEALSAMPVEWIESSDVSEAVLFLASDASRFITGVALPIDAGIMLQ